MVLLPSQQCVELKVHLPHDYDAKWRHLSLANDCAYGSGWVSSPNWQLSLRERQQWPSRPRLILSASDSLTETTFFPLLFVCGRSKLSRITTVTHEVSNKEIRRPGRLALLSVASCLLGWVSVCLCIFIRVRLRVVLTATPSARMSSNCLCLHPSVQAVIYLSIYPSIYSSLLFNEMASHIKVHWLCADKPRFN